MPKSRTRTKKPAALRGIPGALLAKAPSNLSHSDRAEWCRHYLDGAADRPYRRPRGSGIGDWSHRAYRLGASERSVQAEGVLADMATSKRRSDRREGRDVSERVAGLERRLEALTGISPEMRDLGERLAGRIMPGLFDRD